MNRTLLGVLALGCLLGICSGHVRAELITFDDLSGTGSAVPAGYGGLTWGNLQVINAVRSGLVAASPPNVAFTFNGRATIASTDGRTFTFVGADFGAVHHNVVITAFGWRDGKPIYQISFPSHHHKLSFETLNMRTIDTLEFGAEPLYGWHEGGGISGDPMPFIIDDVVTGPQRAPEPASLLLFGIGIAATGLIGFRRRRLNSGPI
jgi:hypothetical protein